jgi:hypothetical protein
MRTKVRDAVSFDPRTSLPVLLLLSALSGMSAFKKKKEMETSAARQLEFFRLATLTTPQPRPMLADRKRGRE